MFYRISFGEKLFYIICNGCIIFHCYLKVSLEGFPRGEVVKTPPANAGETGSSPGPGRSHMLRSN